MERIRRLPLIAFALQLKELRNDLFNMATVGLFILQKIVSQHRCMQIIIWKILCWYSLCVFLCSYVEHSASKQSVETRLRADEKQNLTLVVTHFRV